MGPWAETNRMVRQTVSDKAAIPESREDDCQTTRLSGVCDFWKTPLSYAASALCRLSGCKFLMRLLTDHTAKTMPQGMEYLWRSGSDHAKPLLNKKIPGIGADQSGLACPF
jgi:hypothetical protein